MRHVLFWIWIIISITIFLNDDVSITWRKEKDVIFNEKIGKDWIYIFHPWEIHTIDRTCALGRLRSGRGIRASRRPGRNKEERAENPAIVSTLPNTDNLGRLDVFPAGVAITSWNEERMARRRVASPLFDPSNFKRLSIWNKSYKWVNR